MAINKRKIPYPPAATTTDVLELQVRGAHTFKMQQPWHSDFDAYLVHVDVCARHKQKLCW